MNLIRRNTCQTCAFRHKDTRQRLFCRRNPPTVVTIAQGTGSGYPQVMPSWWCGEFKPMALGQFQNEETPEGEAEPVVRAQ